MNRPPHGICLPVSIHRVIDGDTLEVSVIGSSRHWPIRLLDCWAAELSTPEGQRAKAELLSIVESIDHASLFIPAPKDALKLMTIFSMSRVLGHVFVSHDETLSENMVRRGHATKEKPKETKRESSAP